MGVHAYTCCMCVYTCMCVHMHVCVCVCMRACERERERESRNIINSQYNNTRECIDCFWRLKALYNLKKNMQRANAIYIYNSIFLSNKHYPTHMLIQAGAFRVYIVSAKQHSTVTITCLIAVCQIKLH